MFTLVYSDGNAATRYPLKPGATLIGRAASCDVLLNDTSVSRCREPIEVCEVGCLDED